MSEGIVYLVGAGPGDPGLLSVRGRDLLGRADVVIYDHLVSTRLLDYAGEKAERIYVGKQASAHTVSQEKINELLVERARAGAKVVRLKGGDPFVFGRGGEEALAVVAAGLRFEVVPGITAGVAAPAYAGIPVTHREMASCFSLITGHEAPDKSESSLDWQSLANQKGTLAFYMGVKNLPHICRNLIEHGLAEDTPAGLIRWGTTSCQEVLTGTVSSLPRLVEEAGFKPPALLVIGQVVTLREKLRWFESRPLFGRRIVVTRARSQASELSSRLEELGAEVIELPTIRIEPAEDASGLLRAVGEVGSFDWIVFTSVNAVEAFFEALGEIGQDSRGLAGKKICVIGPATAGRLSQYGIRPDAQPAKFSGEHIVGALESVAKLEGLKILLPRADIAPGDLPDALGAKGAIITEVTAYRTVPDNANVGQVADLLEKGQIHWITFTSSSTVKNFFAGIKPELLGGSVGLASIGPVTSATIVQFGLSPTVEAERYTIDGLIEAIVEHEVKTKEKEQPG